MRANSLVEFTQDYLFPSPPYDGHPSGLPDGRPQGNPRGLATDLALRATKHTARAVGRLMAGSVAAERHLWLNLRGEPFHRYGARSDRKAFLPASNMLSSLKTVTATPRGLACGTSSSSFILGLAVGGRVVFPLLQSVLSPPAGRVCGDTVDSPLQRSDPVLATCQSSTSHSINPDKDAKGSPLWRRVPLLTIRSSYTFQFGEYPPRLDEVQLTVVNSASKASVLQL